MTVNELRDAIAAKSCDACGETFATMHDTLRHFADQHTVISSEDRGPIVIERVILEPFRNERSPRTELVAYYNGEEIHSGWGTETFVAGIVWAVEHVRVCKGVTEHDDVFADFGPEPIDFERLLAQAEADARTIPSLAEWKAP